MRSALDHRQLGIRGQRPRGGRFAVGQRPVECREAPRAAAGIGGDFPPADQACGTVRGDSLLLVRCNQSRVALRDLDGQLRRIQIGEGQYLSAQRLAVGRLQHQSGLVGGEHAEIVAPRRGDVGIGFEHVVARRKSQVQIFDNGCRPVEPACVDQRAYQPDLWLGPVRRMGYRFPVQRFRQIVTLQAAGRNRKPFENVWRRIGPVDTVEQGQCRFVPVGPAKHDDVVAEQVLSCGR
jgi:hypothetical protein